MKRFCIFALVAMLFAACTTDKTQDLRPVDAPESLTVGFEGGDDNTRVQLNEAQKTVWTKDDLVSVFYRSDANQKWQFQGETGERVGNLKRVSAGSATETMKRVVVVYPYNENYYINTDTYNVQAFLPATQHYLADSYGLDGNIMISVGEYNQFSLKNVCGWLKLQLIGAGEKIKSITINGNNGEQVAGEIYINSADATAILAAENGTADDSENGAGGNLIFDDTILTKVKLDCGNGVELGAEPTAFYIALPPQTFEKGLTVEIETTEGKIMEQYTDKEIVIERNTIQPMAALEFEEKIAANQIHYTSSDDTVVTPYKTDVFGANIVSNTYDKEAGYGTITFDGKVTSIGENAFYFCDSLTSVTIPDSVTEIGEDAFSNCTSLKAFYGKFASEDNRCLIVNGTLCSFAIGRGATSYTIPDSVTSIGMWAFSYCTSLTSITIPDSVTEIEDSAFSSCSSLTSVTIGNGVTSIGGHAFHRCKSLTSVTIPDSVTSIETAAFCDCTSLTSVTIPDSVTEIGGSAFQDCTSLKEVYCKPTTPPTGGYYMFSYYDGNGSFLPIGCKIYVPTSDDDSIINDYKAKLYWSDYASYIEEYDFSAEQ
ncbi:MAG: leucine-rich repeat domain-containing protein [Alistipes sp.]|nr:leucine-rich repeat domain-containing protein [Alistipes sp.]